MKTKKSLTVIILLIGILLSLSVNSSAIGFEAETVYNSVFIVRSGDSLGSGFAIGKNSIVTNAHVITDKKSVTLTTYDGDDFKAEIFSIDAAKDIAVLITESKELAPLKMLMTKDISVGNDVYAIGAPKALSYTLTKGVVSSKNRNIGDYSYIQTDAAINEGNSGGPLLNDDGYVTGMNSMKLSDSEGIGLAIPSDMIISYLNDIGVKTDENGNVVDLINGNTSEKAENPSGSNADNEQPAVTDSEKSIDEKAPAKSIITLSVLLAVSVACNIVLIIALVFKKQKNIESEVRSDERTDFEIDLFD